MLPSSRDEVLPVKRPWIAISCALFVAFAIAFVAFFGRERPLLSNLFDENPYLMTKVASSSATAMSRIYRVSSPPTPRFHRQHDCA
jgi:hypothetical protein